MATNSLFSGKTIFSNIDCSSTEVVTLLDTNLTTRVIVYSKRTFCVLLSETFFPVELGSGPDLRATQEWRNYFTLLSMTLR